MVVHEPASSGDAVVTLVVQTHCTVFAQQQSCVTTLLRVHPHCEAVQGNILF